MPTADDEPPFGVNDPKIRTPKPRLRLRAEFTETEPEETTPPTPFVPDEHLPGSVFMVPNRHWGFEIMNSDDHPGACAHYQERARQAILVKGTDAENIYSPQRFYVVVPTPSNGLLKKTAFELVPRYFRLHRIRLFYPERHLGWLDEATLHGLCHELARLHPEE